MSTPLYSAPLSSPPPQAPVSAVSEPAGSGHGTGRQGPFSSRGWSLGWPTGDPQGSGVARQCAAHTTMGDQHPCGCTTVVPEKTDPLDPREGAPAGTAVLCAVDGGQPGSRAAVRSSTPPPGGPGLTGMSSGTARRGTTLVG
jgi:hypothetical protein